MRNNYSDLQHLYHSPKHSLSSYPNNKPPFSPGFSHGYPTPLPKPVASPLFSFLKQIKVPQSQLSKLQPIDNPEHLLYLSLPLLRSRFQQLSNISQSLTSQLQSLKSHTTKQHLQTQQLTQTITTLTNKESFLKTQITNSSKQWDTANETIIKLRLDLQSLDNELFDKNKLLVNSQQENRVFRNKIDLLTKELEGSVQLVRDKERDNERDKQMFRLQQCEIFKILEIKQQEIDQLSIKNNFTEQEYEIIQRQYFRWKERCEAQSEQLRRQGQMMSEREANIGTTRRETPLKSEGQFSYSENTYSSHPPIPNRDYLKSPRGADQDRVKELNQQIRNLNEKFRVVNEEKIRLYVELEQIKQLLLLHGIQYDHIEDAPLIQLIRRQKQKETNLSRHRY